MKRLAEHDINVKTMDDVRRALQIMNDSLNETQEATTQIVNYIISGEGGAKENAAKIVNLRRYASFPFGPKQPTKAGG